MARAVIDQWENEYISPPVLSMARVMIAQWDNECISLSVFSVAWVMIAQWENAVYLTACSLHGPGHDSSVFFLVEAYLSDGIYAKGLSSR